MEELKSIKGLAVVVVPADAPRTQFLWLSWSRRRSLAPTAKFASQPFRQCGPYLQVDPENYSGDQWETFSWNQTLFKIKQLVGTALQPLVTQTMNHCVTNLYRDGNDFIAHHSDKDLDLNREGVNVSVSLGDERIMELKRRSEPKDVILIRLPHRSMLVLGPKTNKQFSHSILPKEEI